MEGGPADREAGGIPRRGEVWLVAFGAVRAGEAGRTRPAVVVSVPELLGDRLDDVVAVVPLSSSASASRLRPDVGPEAGIERSSRAMCRSVRSVARSRLLRPVGAVARATLEQIGRSLTVVLGLDA